LLVSIDIIARDNKNYLIMFAVIFVILSSVFLWAKKNDSEVILYFKMNVV